MRRRSPYRIGPAIALLAALFVLMAPDLPAQNSGGTWRFDTVRTTVGFDLPRTFSPSVEIDPWGVRQLFWVTRDPNSAGLQIYRSDDAVGPFGAPFLLSDTGTVYDTLGIDTLSYRAAVDRRGHRHLLFLANVPEQAGLEIGLYYANDRGREFLDDPPLRLTTESGRYDLAVDSAGIPHVVWLRESQTPGLVEVRYWTETIPPIDHRLLGTFASGSPGSPTSDPVLEISGNRLQVFVRNDSGVVFAAAGDINDFPLTFTALGLPAYGPPDPTPLPTDPRDYHLVGALDLDGNYHLLAPIRRSDRTIELWRLTDAIGLNPAEPIVQLDSTLLGLDIGASGSGRVVGAWTGFRGAFPLDIPKSGMMDVRKDQGTWETTITPDLVGGIANPDREWRIVGRIGVADDRLALPFSRFADARDTLTRGVGLAVQGPRELTIADILPDAAAPGMSVVVELFAPADDIGAFGPDRFDPDDLSVATLDPADTARIVVGPVVSSWDGRLASVLLFIAPDATPGDVELVVRTAGRTSTPITFRIVEPQRIGIDGSGRLAGGGLLGSGGIFGTRTTGNTMVVDSLLLFDGTYSVLPTDLDPTSDGIEGMRPLVILARGGVRIDSTAVLTVSAPNPLSNPTGTAGPGGGGGGASLEWGAGLGFTAGGLPGDRLLPDPGPETLVAGSGSLRSSFRGGGGARVGTRGGVGRPEVAAGGGTGHPFGVSGRYGRFGDRRPLAADTGGRGAGTGGNRQSNGFATGGGGGGYARGGDNGGPLTINGGRPVGSRYLVPLAGGSGGGGGYSDRGRSVGGGGGGALALYTERSLQLLGRIEADGGDGTTGTQGFDRSGGGGGSGGGVLIGAKGGIVLGPKGTVSVEGGDGGGNPGPQGSSGGEGGPGRVRVDGAIDKTDTTLQLDPLSADYFGPSTDMSGSFSADADTNFLTGAAQAGRTLRIYTKEGTDPWSYDRPIDVVVDTAGRWRQGITTDGAPIYVAVLERVDETSDDGYADIPAWVMSTAGGLVIGRPDVALESDTVRTDCVDFGSCTTVRVRITNTGSQSDLFLTNPRIEGGGGAWTIGEISTLRIPPGSTVSIPIRFCPRDSGTSNARFRFETNVVGASPRTVHLVGCGRAGRLVSSDTTLDIGSLCVGDCRDTTITLSNRGDAPLDITRIDVDRTRIAITTPGTTFPLTLAPNEERLLPIRICLLSGTGPTTLTIRSTTPFIAPTVRVLVENDGPDVTALDAETTIVRDIGATDTCGVRAIRLVNNRTDRPARIEEIAVGRTEFSILSPAIGTEIGPGDTVAVLVRFCGTEIGEIPDTVRVRLVDGSCDARLALPILGRVTRSRPSPALDVSDKIDLGNVPVGRSSAPRTIRIVNSGAGIARGVRVDVEAIAPTNPGEFAVDRAGTPFDVAPGSQERIEVTLTPDVEGLRSARLIFSSDDGWRDTVEVCGTGIEPGIVADSSRVDFGEVRGTDPSLRTIRFFNLGSGGDRITAILLDDSTDFAITTLELVDGTPVSLPITLRPNAADTLVVRLRMSPTSPGSLLDTLRALTEASGLLVVPFLGLSTIERAEIDAVLLRIDCPIINEENRATLRLENTGTRPMSLDRIVIDGRDAGQFRVVDDPSPTTIGAGAGLTIEVAYLGAQIRADAELRLETSAPELLRVRLEGLPCAPEQSDLGIVVPDRAANIGEELTIPIELVVDGPLPTAVDLDLTLQVDVTTLLPNGAEGPTPGGDIVPIPGILSSPELTEVTPGTIRIEGEIPSGATSGTLVEIPVVVLRGRHYRTPLDLSLTDGVQIPVRYRLGIVDGIFTSLDCDTTGGIDLSGIFAIRPARPTPASDRVTIDFEIPREDRVTVRLFDNAGRVVALLLDGVIEGGRHEVQIDLRSLSAGIYYLEIESGPYRSVEAIVVQQ